MRTQGHRGRIYNLRCHHGCHQLWSKEEQPHSCCQSRRGGPTSDKLFLISRMGVEMPLSGLMGSRGDMGRGSCCPQPDKEVWRWLMEWERGWGAPLPLPWLLEIAGTRRHASRAARAEGGIMACNNKACVALGQHSCWMGDRKVGFPSHLHLCGPQWVSKWSHASVSPLVGQERSHPCDRNGDK